MPYFDYLCKACGHIFDDRANFDDYSKIACPHGCGLTSERLPSLPAPARGSFGTVSRKPTKASTTIRDEKLKEEFNKE
jgi:putative FmdB family regulatory protein